jgi:hypothetical protein
LKRHAGGEDHSFPHFLKMRASEVISATPAQSPEYIRGRDSSPHSHAAPRRRQVFAIPELLIELHRPLHFFEQSRLVGITQRQPGPLQQRDQAAVKIIPHHLEHQRHAGGGHHANRDRLAMREGVIGAEFEGVADGVAKV